MTDAELQEGMRRARNARMVQPVEVYRAVLEAAIEDLRTQDADSASAQALADAIDRTDGLDVSPAMYPKGDR